MKRKLSGFAVSGESGTMPNKRRTMILTAKNMEELDALMAGQKTALILLHNQPDPDALAGGLGLKTLFESRYRIRTAIAYSGLIGRAENLAMVRELRIPAVLLDRIQIRKMNRIALLDSQPGSGNNALPLDVHCHLIIDHHPRRRGLDSEVTWIYPEYGTTATMIIELLNLADVQINSRLATAFAYAIRSETQDLGRESSQQDVEAYMSVLLKSSMKTLSRIAYPDLTREYYESLGAALKGSRTYRQILVCYMGTVPMPEIVAEMADFLLRYKRITWTLCAGVFQESLFLSMRTSNARGQAGRILKRLVTSGNAGGHDMFAGGRIDLTFGVDDPAVTAENIFRRFAAAMGYAKADWRPML